jgi:hypothetical protein
MIVERSRYNKIAFPLAPSTSLLILGWGHRPSHDHETFAWMGGGASPRHVNVTGWERRRPLLTG